MPRKTIVPNIAYDTQRRTYYVTMRSRSKDGGPSRRTVAFTPAEVSPAGEAGPL